MTVIDTGSSIADLHAELSHGSVVLLTQDYDQIVFGLDAAKALHAWLGSVISHPSAQRFLKVNPDDVHDAAGA